MHFLQLPEDLIGHVYSFLDVESRKAFIATHPSVQSAPSVLDQIHKLTVSLEEADQPNPLLSFPRGERLQELVIWADFSYSFPPRNDVPLILALLRPQDGASHQHVMQIIGHVEELTFLGCRLREEQAAADLGHLIRQHMPKLRVLRFQMHQEWGHYYPGHDSNLQPSLLQALAQAECLEELHMEGLLLTQEQIQATSQYHNLKVLGLQRLKNARLKFEFCNIGDNLFSVHEAVTKLQALEELHVEFFVYHYDYNYLPCDTLFEEPLLAVLSAAMSNKRRSCTLHVYVNLVWDKRIENAGPESRADPAIVERLHDAWRKKSAELQSAGGHDVVLNVKMLDGVELSV
ncbi:hypothetical protein DUNSADRAFT_17027 [Dunaliella salina]|uniref:F-box domain-containing protein n=1 Tax=Dunaliella salina TaxID=3046 RepID=A0ABQ7G2I2_DUNSA|nr:hypothetical protein DUNSADRAFT_17027 [Dunaliella salina]|eukprot:KAF5828810.1 hypothetical protein DUNSADRAFT_17027 [Dunaliella salina]